MSDKRKSLHDLVQASERLGLYEEDQTEALKEITRLRQESERFPQHTFSVNILPFLKRLWEWVRR